MNKTNLIAIAIFSCLFLSGCWSPDHVSVINSPTAGIFFTIETSYGHGAPSPDYTRVYAHFERGGKSRKALVLGGDYLTVSKVVWTSPLDATICMDGGFTDTFRNQVTLIVGSASETIHNHLQEACK